MTGQLILFGLFLAAILSKFGGSYYEGKWLGFGLCFVALFSHAFSQKFGAVPAVFVGYLLCSALWVLLYAQNRYASIDGNELTAIKLFSVEAAFKLLLVLSPLLLLNVSSWVFREWGMVFSAAFLFSSLGKVFFEALTKGCAETNACGGILMNPSLNAGAMVCVLPLVTHKVRLRVSVPIIASVGAACVLGQSGVGLLMLSLFLAIHNWRVIPIGVAAVLGRVLYSHKTLLSLGDRDVMWAFLLDKWAHNRSNWLFGTGFGTFDLFSFSMQNTFHMREQYWWKWMHNDFLELLITNGAFGLSLGIAVLGMALYGLWKKGYVAELKSLLLFSGTMACNYPLRIGLTAAFGAWLAYLGLKRETA